MMGADQMTIGLHEQPSALDALRSAVLQANRRLVDAGLAPYRFGNASARLSGSDLIVIKPSGVDLAAASASDMAVVSLGDGQVVAGRLRPSVDLPTHLELYRAFPELGGVVHTHSRHATAFAQACRELPCLGTTHADYFDGAVPVTRDLQPSETDDAYEAATGRVILECLRERALSPLRMPAVLVARHGPFTWGRSVEDAVQNALLLEEVAQLALLSMQLGATEPAPSHLARLHFDRKHGPAAYYGQQKRAS